MNLFVEVAEIALVVLAVLMVADLLSGLVHWLEDSYGHEDLPVIGPLVIQANVLHHFDPRHMVHHSWFSSARAPLAVVGIGLAVAFFAGLLSWPLILVGLITANANEIHKLAHRSKVENGRIVTLVQRTGLLQSRAHHANHHQSQKDSNYCVVTNYLNPVLERIRFWRLLETSIFLLSGVRKRQDPSTTALRRSYPVPSCSNPTCRLRQQSEAA